MMRTTALLALVLVSCCLIAQAGDRSQDMTAVAVAARLEQRLHSLRSLQADFEQTYRSASMAAPLTESGRVFFQRPGRMRWEYLKPEAKVFLYKDGVFEQYYAEDNQLIRSRISPEDSGAEILSILTGVKKLRDGYAVETDPSPLDLKGVSRVKLTPLQEGEYSHILLDMRNADSLLARAIFVDFGGNRTEFVFKKPKPDVRIPAGVFELKIPRDCEVIDDLPPAPLKKQGW